MPALTEAAEGLRLPSLRSRGWPDTSTRPTRDLPRALSHMCDRETPQE